VIARLAALARGYLRRGEIESEIDEELRDHLEREIEMHRARGLSPAEARRLALRDLGGLTQTQEETRDVRSTWADSLARDFRYATRVLRRSPRFTVTALALLVLGIGSTTAILSIVYAVLVRPLPYPDADRLIHVTEKDGIGVAWPNYQDWLGRTKSFEVLGGSLVDAAILKTAEAQRRFEARNVTAGFFRVLGAAPHRGRLFDDADARPGAPRTVVVSYAFWQRELGGADAAIGRSITLGTSTAQVIGVLPPGFRYLQPTELYLLLEPRVADNFRGMQSRTTHTGFYVVGRLRPEVDVASARAELATIQAALDREYSTDIQQRGVEVSSLADRIVGDMGPTLAVVGGAVALLLLITCVNLAGLLLNRSAIREHEFRIRSAIGGSRWDVVRQLLVEHGVLISAGAALGVAAGAFMLYGLLQLAPRDLPRLDEIHIDLAVMGWLTLLSAACAFIFGVVPALRTSDAGGDGLVIRSARGVARSGRAMRSGLMIGEIALATVLLAGSGLMVRTMVQLSRVDPGFDAKNLQTVMFSLQGAAWPDERQQDFYPAVVERIRAIPGVKDAALTYSLPILGSNWWNVFMIAGTTPVHWTLAGEFPNAGMAPVSSGYFEMLAIPLLKGRYFDGSDTRESRPVAIVNASAAKKYWPGQDPIGKQIQQGFPDKPYGPWRTIVGVVGDVRQNGVDQELPRQIYLPAVQQPRTTMFAIARRQEGVPTVAIEKAIHELDATIPVFNDRTIAQVMSEASARRRIAMVVLCVFGGVALMLAAIGLYGVIAQGVADRRQEIGVRMALGATSGQVVRLFLRHGVFITAVGIPVGVAAAMFAARSLDSLVFGISVSDPVTLGAVVAVLAAIALLACYLPARAATRIDPLRALRAD
jgi:putative ABC transport system permease protein